MVDDNPMQRTALVIPVYEAVPLIQAFRAAHIHTPAASMPPHVTIRGPFISFDRIDESVHEALKRIFGTQPQFPFTLRKIGSFQGGVLYLDPEPETPFHALRLALEKQFPEANPDFFASRKMHVTLARCKPENIHDVEAEFLRECGAHLPIEAAAAEVCLYEKRDRKWHLRETYPLAGAGGIEFK